MAPSADPKKVDMDGSRSVRLAEKYAGLLLSMAVLTRKSADCDPKHTARITKAPAEHLLERLGRIT